MRSTDARPPDRSVRWLDSVLFLLDQNVTDVEEMGPESVDKLFAQIKKRRR
jgi:hypothetical protein